MPNKFNCVRCKKDTRLSIYKGGCECCREHSPDGYKIETHSVDYSAYDGYGSFDYVMCLIDHDCNDDLIATG